MPDGKACEDLNECLSTPAVCSQICENAFGSYHCKCAPGYIREADGRTCRQNSGIAPYLLYSNRYYIRNLTTDGSHLSIVLQGLSNVVALDFDHSEKRLYWLDAGTRKIERMRFEGTDRETLAEDVVGAEGLALDWVGRYVEVGGTSLLKLSLLLNNSLFNSLFNKLVQTPTFYVLVLLTFCVCCRKLYWSDSYYGAVHVMELDGRYQKSLLSGDFMDRNATYIISRPRAVAVNPKYGY